jgi:pimeloyl-ACP methyl ester carboxylesterase
LPDTCSLLASFKRHAHRATALLLPSILEKEITMKAESTKNVVLVHGAFVDGSGWQGVHDQLKKDGYNVAVVQNPTLSLKGDVEVTRKVIAEQNGPVVLVGHSYGGAVITEAGNDPKVAALVYVAAFAPDKGESVNALVAKAPPEAKLEPKGGFLVQDPKKFPASFAADVKPELAAFMADSQVPWGVEAANASITDPAWRVKPSWYLIATDDKMIPPPSQRAMSKRAGSTVVESAGSHAIYISKPAVVTALIEQAASAGGERRQAR